MGRRRNPLPTLCIDRSRNRAYCRVNGKFVVLGAAGSPEAQAAYGKLLADLAQQGDAADLKVARRRSAAPATFSLQDLFLRFAVEELPRYSRDEQHCLRGALKVARALFGGTPVAEFGPLRLRLIRDEMIRKGWSRGYTNRQIKRLRTVIRWGVSWEIVPQTVADSLSSVKPLGIGETDAPEGRQRRSVPQADISAVRAVLSDLHRDLLDLMLLTGARPGELVSLTGGILDRSADVWRADLAQHKTRHHGKSRTLFFNVTAQAILLRHLKADPDARLFDLQRVTFGNAIKRACEVAFGMPDELRALNRKPTKAELSDPNYREPTPAERAELLKRAQAWRRQHVWTPHWLRHTVATKLADEVGTEAAQRLLGHASRAMTEHYSKAAEKVAVDAAKRLG